MDEILTVDGLKTWFPVHGGVFRRVVAQVHAVDGVSFSLRKGETLGIVGESGCGKSSLGKTLIGLNKPTSGRIKFLENSLESLTHKEWKSYYRKMSMIFQDPFSSLDPRMTVEKLISEPLVIQGIGDDSSRKKKVASLVERVGLSLESLNRYPHEFSGGQRQRIGIARALATSPSLLIADEPVAALDVSVQAQVLNLLRELREEMNLSMIFISHDLGVVRFLCDRVAVMYLGVIVEIGSRDDIQKNAQHPYTQALMSAVPPENPWSTVDRQVLQGDVPSPMAIPSGCRFHTRCPQAVAICKEKIPKVKNLKRDHQVACHLIE
ncbi:MAG: ABC transporter ATP-binding protein [Oligoflexales bacterium]